MGSTLPRQSGRATPPTGARGQRVSELNPDGSTPDICQECGVDHRWELPDLSHGIIRLILHVRKDMGIWWMEFPANGDMIARQRSGLIGKSLLNSTSDPDEINWDVVEERRRGSA